MRTRRVTLLAGHYGSGKTNIAVNLAFARKKEGFEVTVADLDIVNPYYRMKDSEEALKEAGIPLISSAFANSNVDLPALPQELYRIIDDKNGQMIVDIGGDDRGAYALGRFAGALKKENDYEMILVINGYRPLTGDEKETAQIMKEIEDAGHLPFTGIINNSNLGNETTAEDILASVSYAEKTSRETGLPLLLTTVRADLLPQLTGKIDNLFGMTLQKSRLW